MMKKCLIMSVFSGLFMTASFAQSFSVSSPSFSNGDKLSVTQEYNAFGCQGANLSPEIRWDHPPAGTKSFAVTVFDPDAPTGSGWWHWTVANIPKEVRQLPVGVGVDKQHPLPTGAVQGRNDYGQASFGGACPPEGDTPHRYIITVWALGVDQLPIDAQTSGAMVGYFLHANQLARAELTPVYSR